MDQGRTRCLHECKVAGGGGGGEGLHVLWEGEAAKGGKTRRSVGGIERRPPQKRNAHAPKDKKVRWVSESACDKRWMDVSLAKANG